MKLLSLITFICQVVYVAASTSYVSLRNQDIVDARVSSTEDIIEKATLQEPVVILQFDKAKILEALANDDYNVPFLNNFFKHGVTNVLTDESKLSIKTDDDEETFVYKMNGLDFDPIDILKEANVEKRRAVWFKFEDKDYDIRDLDQYVESIIIFVEEYLNVNADIILNSADTMTLEEFDVDVEYQTATYNSNEKSHSTKAAKTSATNGKNDDILSETWTEGLLMCLLVSFLLLVILLVALSWISSLDISYGALEKSTNPLKKNE